MKYGFKVIVKHSLQANYRCDMNVDFGLWSVICKSEIVHAALKCVIRMIYIFLVNTLNDKSVQILS